MNIEHDMQLITEQERTLRFDKFNSETAWAIGSALRADALARSAGMTFEIQLAGRTLFLGTTDGAKAEHADWIRRKRNVVMKFARSSYWMSLELLLKGKSMVDRHEGTSYAEYAMHGGAFPIYLNDTGLIGTIIASGLHQRVDHAMVVDAIAGVLGIDVLRLETL
jgi:uncharacterized protein (UPF0303 family)